MSFCFYALPTIHTVISLTMVCEKKKNDFEKVTVLNFVIRTVNNFLGDIFALGNLRLCFPPVPWETHLLRKCSRC